MSSKISLKFLELKNIFLLSSTNGSMTLSRNEGALGTYSLSGYWWFLAIWCSYRTTLKGTYSMLTSLSPVWKFSSLLCSHHHEVSCETILWTMMLEGDRSFTISDGHPICEDLQAAVTGFQSLWTFATPYATKCTLHTSSLSLTECFPSFSNMLFSLV